MEKKLSEYTQDEMVALLKSNVKEWNRLRGEEPRFKPDLSGADLLHTNLVRANLEHANLVRAKLAGSILYNANLQSADLARANLLYADLARADLVDTNLVDANLGGADLRDANLVRASFYKTNLKFANLEKIKGSFNLDKESVRISGSLPKNFLISGGFPEFIFDQVHDNGSTVTVTFTKGVWGNLVPIEQALHKFLKGRYQIRKTPDQIIVEVENEDLLEEALYAILPVLAGMHEAVPNSVHSIEASPEDGKAVEVKGDDLAKKLEEMSAQLERIEAGQKQPEKKVWHEMMIAIWKELPLVKLLHPIIRKGLESPNQITVMNALRKGYRKIFGGIAEVEGIPAGKEQKLLEAPREED